MIPYWETECAGRTTRKLAAKSSFDATVRHLATVGETYPVGAPIAEFEKR